MWTIRLGTTFECADCGHQTSLTSGTVLEKTRKPLMHTMTALTALAGRRTDRQAALDTRVAVLTSEAEVADEKLRRLYEPVEKKLSSGEIPFRKAYIRSIVDRIEVDDRCIRIMGRKDVLEQAVLAEGGSATPVVHSIVAKWRAGQDETANTYVIDISI